MSEGAVKAIDKRKERVAPEPNGAYRSLVGGIVGVIDDAKHAAASSANAATAAAYWLIGRYIVEFEQGGKERADYGAALLRRLAIDLVQQFGRGFSRPNLQQMRLFYLAYSPHQICQTPSGQSQPLDAGQMHLYLNYAREHWLHEHENPPVGLILCAEKGESLARYALEGLPNKVMAAEYRTALPDEALLAAEIDRARDALNGRNGHLAASRGDRK